MSVNDAKSVAKGGARPKVRNSYAGERKVNVNFNEITNSKLPSNYQKNCNAADEIELSTVPLDKREITAFEGGIQVKRPALSPDWVTKRVFMPYSKPPLAHELIEGEVDAWLERAQFLQEDLRWLLGLPHHMFWCQVVYDKNVKKCLDSYLMDGPRWYDDLTYDQSCSGVLTEIHRLIFLIYLRLSTYKESKDDCITPSKFAELIYDNCLFDISKLLDLCSLFGASTGTLLSKMLENIFSHQPKFFKDLTELATTVKSVLSLIEDKLGIRGEEIPQCALPESSIPMSFEEVKDVTLYYLDIVSSILMLVSVFPKSCDIFHRCEFELILASSYEKIVPCLVAKCNLADLEDGTCEDDQNCRKVVLLDMIKKCRLTSVRLYRKILEFACFNSNSEEPEDLSRRMEAFCHLMSSCIEEKIFLLDYSSIFDLSKDFLCFKDQGVDMTAINFLEEAVNLIRSEFCGLSSSVKGNAESMSTNLKIESLQDDSSGMGGYYNKEKDQMSSVEIESLISSIQDLLPDLGNGFVAECLKYYCYSTEEVLNALLEDNLPPHLQEIDRNLALEVDRPTTSQPTSQSASQSSIQSAPHQSDSQDVSSELDKSAIMSSSCQGELEATNVETSGTAAPSSVLSQRKNVYDNDEFDVFNHPSKVAVSRVHKGKRQARGSDTLDPLLKEKMKAILNRYDYSAGYSIYEDELKYTPITDYDDEYDDTYDDHDRQEVDDDTYDKRKSHHFSTIFGKGALNQRGMNFVDSEENEEGVEEVEENEVEEGGRPTSNNAGVENSKFRTKLNQSGEPRQTQSTSRTKLNQSVEPRQTQSTSRTKLNQSVEPRQTQSTSRTKLNQSDEPRQAQSTQSTSRSNQFTPTNSQDDSPRLTFEPFCENPEITRQRFMNKKLNREFRNKGFHSSQSDPPNHQSSSSGPPPHPKVHTKTNKHSGKNWRQGSTDDSMGGSSGRPHGGKYKEDTNHGKAQDKNYRHKMIHKSDQRKAGAQFKYRNS